MKKLFLLHLIFVTLLFSGCATKSATNPAGTVALINGEPVTETMIIIQKTAMIFQQKMQRQSLADSKSESGDDDQRLQEKIAELEEDVAVEITDNLVFNRLVREMVQVQAAGKQGIKVLGNEIEEMIRQSREAEKNLDPAAADTKLIIQVKEGFMAAMGMDSDQEVEDYQRGRMKISMISGRLETAIKEKMAATLALEHPELVGEKFKPALEELYQNYVDKLLQDAKIEVLDSRYSIVPREQE